jgi:rod shape-determining protein MreD
VLIAVDQWLQWRVAKAVGAEVPLVTMVPPLIISVCVFPLSAWLVSKLDSWRVGR